ncbi:MAG: hypothetical protein EA422_00920 [Gemmatimonadales bacterium]|nr:MAG: hypothetical protein EA422_00920 [Gemmatimonadales bacterium]
MTLSQEISPVLYLPALLGLLLLLPGALPAQDRVALPELREGTEFHRVVTGSQRSETPGRAHEETSHLEARLRVIELREDGSGIFEIEPTVYRVERTGPDGEVRSWDSATDPEPTEGQFRVIPEFIGHTFRVPFLPGGELDPVFFQASPESEVEMLGIWGIASLMGPQDRPDGIPSGLPRHMEVGALAEPMPIAMDPISRARYRLVGVEEREGRLEGLVEISGEMGVGAAGGEISEARLTGRIRIDVERGEVMESVMSMSHQMAVEPDSHFHFEFTFHTIPVL